MEFVKRNQIIWHVKNIKEIYACYIFDHHDPNSDVNGKKCHKILRGSEKEVEEIYDRYDGGEHDDDYKYNDIETGIDHYKVKLEHIATGQEANITFYNSDNFDEFNNSINFFAKFSSNEKKMIFEYVQFIKKFNKIEQENRKLISKLDEIKEVI